MVVVVGMTRCKGAVYVSGDGGASAEAKGDRKGLVVWGEVGVVGIGGKTASGHFESMMACS